MYELEIIGHRQLNTLNTSTFVFLNDMFFTDDKKVGFMGQQREHDKICICTVVAMSGVRIVVWAHSGLANVVKHLVLTFSGNIAI